jgi:hypothetical protein
MAISSEDNLFVLRAFAELVAIRDILGSCPSEVPIVVVNNSGLVPLLQPTATPIPSPAVGEV